MDKNGRMSNNAKIKIWMTNTGGYGIIKGTEKGMEVIFRPLRLNKYTKTGGIVMPSRSARKSKSRRRGCIRKAKVHMNGVL